MKKLIIASTVAGGLVVIAAGASLFFSNRQVDHLIEQAQTSVSAPMAFSVVSDENSLWQRDITLSFKFDDAEQPFELLVRNEIEKSLLGSTISHSVRLGDSLLAAIDDQDLRAVVQQEFVDQAFITGETHISMNQQYKSDVSSIAIEQNLEAATLKMQPFIVQVSGNLNGALVMDGQWGGLTVSQDSLEKIAFTFEPIRFSAEGEYLQGSVFVGEQTLSGEGFNLILDSQWQPLNLALQEYQIESTGELVDERFQGDVRINLDGLNMQEEGSELSVDQLSMGLSVSGIDIENYSKLMQALNEFQTTGVQSDAMTFEVNQFLRNGFSLGLNNWFAQLGDERFNFNGSVTVPENELADIENPFSFLGLFGSVSANANLEMDSALAERPELNSLLLPVLMTGALISDQQQYKMSFSLDDGIAKLNGEPLPLPF